MKNRKQKHMTTKNNHNGSDRILNNFVNQCKAKGTKVVALTETEPITDPISIVFCYHTNSVVLQRVGILDKLHNYLQGMKGQEKFMLEQVEDWNSEFTTMPDEIKIIWCMNIYCLTKVGIIQNDKWNGVAYLVER